MEYNQKTGHRNDLYESPEWKSLSPKIDRAQLLLVIEGLKRGTIINGNWTNFLEILEKTGLDYRLNTPNLRLNPVMRVARPEVLEEEAKRKLAIPNPMTPGAYHRLNGWFLGYPSCCVEEYTSPQLTIPQIKDFKNYRRYKFGRELEDTIKRDGTYPDVFDYCPPSFTPCSVNCENAKSMLKSYKNALETLDPEAAKKLVYFNRSSEPERYVTRGEK